MPDVTVSNRTVVWQGAAGNRRPYADPFQNSPGFVDSSHPN
jgi:hypothetical protein